jgi:hypothetical protein
MPPTWTMTGLNGESQQPSCALDARVLEPPKFYKNYNNWNILIDIQLSIDIYGDNLFEIQPLTFNLVRNGP